VHELTQNVHGKGDKQQVQPAADLFKGMTRVGKTHKGRALMISEKLGSEKREKRQLGVRSRLQYKGHLIQDCAS